MDNIKPVQSKALVAINPPIQTKGHPTTSANSTLKSCNNTNKTSSKIQNLQKVIEVSGDLVILGFVYSYLGKKSTFNGYLKELSEVKKTKNQDTWPVVKQHISSRYIQSIAAKKKAAGIALSQRLSFFKRVPIFLRYYKEVLFCSILHFAIKGIFAGYKEKLTKTLSTGIEAFLKRNLQNSPEGRKSTKTLPDQLTKECDSFLDCVLEGMYDFAKDRKKANGHLRDSSPIKYIRHHLNGDNSEKKFHDFIKDLINNHIKSIPVFCLWRQSSNPIKIIFGYIFYPLEKFPLPRIMRYFLKKRIPTKIKELKDKGIESTTTTAFKLVITKTLKSLLKPAKTAIEENEHNVTSTKDSTPPQVEQNLKRLSKKIIKAIKRHSYIDRDKLRNYIDNEETKTVNPINNPKQWAQEKVDTSIEDSIQKGFKLFFKLLNDPECVNKAQDKLIESLNELFKPDFINDQTQLTKEYDKEHKDLTDETKKLLNKVFDSSLKAQFYGSKLSCGPENTLLENQEKTALKGDNKDIKGLKSESHVAFRKLKGQLRELKKQYETISPTMNQRLQHQESVAKFKKLVSDYKKILNKWAQPDSTIIGFEINSQVAKELKKKVAPLLNILPLEKKISQTQKDLETIDQIKNRILSLKNLILPLRDKNSNQALEKKELILEDLKFLKSTTYLRPLLKQRIETLETELESDQNIPINIIEQSLDRALISCDSYAKIKRDGIIITIDRFSNTLFEEQKLLEQTSVASYEKGSTLSSTVLLPMIAHISGIAIPSMTVLAATNQLITRYLPEKYSTPLISGITTYMMTSRAAPLAGIALAGVGAAAGAVANHLVPKVQSLAPQLLVTNMAPPLRHQFADDRVNQALNIIKEPYMYEGMVKAILNIHLASN